MSAWSNGYITDIGYTYGYYSELNPLRTIPPLLQEGFAVPVFKNACELGFGQGISINAHAAAGRARWYGTDFNPSHAAFARDTAAISGSNALLVDQSFEEFCQRDDLPEFEFIGLHGIWSWISDENRHIITDFIRRKLAIGGILYISYNTLPGWAAHAPIRHLLSMHNTTMSSQKDNHEQKVKNALAFGSHVLENSHMLQKNTPNITSRLNNLKEQNTNYLVHEYMNRDWLPMYFADIASYLEPAKINFACSASYLDDFAPCLYNTEQQALMDEVANTPMAQTVKDFVLNKQFRRDLWIKGSRRLNAMQLAETRKKQRFVLTTARQSVEMSAANIISANLIPEIFDPILDIFADHKIHSVSEVQEKMDGKINLIQIFTALTVLHAKGDMTLVQDDNAADAARPRCRAFNTSVLASVRGSNNEISYLTSPLSGGAIPVAYTDLLFLSERERGAKSPEQWAQGAWKLLQAQNRLMIKDGETLRTETDNLAELNRLATEFAQQRLPGLQALDVIS